MSEEQIIIRPHAGSQRLFTKTNVNVCFSGGVLGSGKALSINELVLTPNGWKKWGDLQFGDVISSPFHGTTTVTYVTPTKKYSLYRVKTLDGRSVLAHDEHLWYVRTKKQRQKFNKNHLVTKNYSVMTTKQLMEGMAKGNEYYIPLPYAFYAEEKDFVIPPYVLGVLLGDGCMTINAHLNNTLIISNDEEDIIARCAYLLGATYRMHNDNNYDCSLIGGGVPDVNDEVRGLGIAVKSPYRFIPEEYKWGSVYQRKELLAGLFDTDGNITPKGNSCSYSYSTTSERLRDDVIELCRGLGYIATFSVDKRSSKYTSGEAYKIIIQTHEKIFRSEKHASRYKDSSDRPLQRKKNHVTIESITYEKDDLATCITVDDPEHIYITTDFIVSHNTFGAALATAEPILDHNWRGLVVKNNLDDLKRGGGVIDTFHKELYGEWTTLRMSEMPRLTSPYGSWIDFAHLADQSIETIQRRFKGSQYDWIYFDELTGFTWDAFKTLLTRNRGKSGYAGRCLATTNPERECWIRKFIDWYIGEDGLIMPERDGVVRYFYVTGSKVEDVVWGDTKEEVYELCKYSIDKQLDGIFGFNKGRDKWQHMIRSFVFYLGRMSENSDMLEKNMDYIGAIAMSGGAEASKLLEGNWNVSSREEENNLITYDDANSVFLNDPQTNGDRWVTCDLADEGTDNVVMLAWDGLHIVDIELIMTSTPKENAEHLKAFAFRNDVADSHIIFDALRAGIYINDYIPEAIPFNSSRAAEGGNAMQYVRLKECCYGKLVYLIKNNGISCDDKVAHRFYEHQKLKSRITVQDEFIEEARVIRFVDVQSGKKRLMTKKEMNRNLGKGRSMDLLDPCCMRMYPLLNTPDGFELENSRREYESRRDDEKYGETFDVFDETNFGISYDF